MARPRGVLGLSRLHTQYRFQSCRRESVAIRLSRHAAGWTHGLRFASPDPVPTHTESHPFGPRSFRSRCRLAFAIPESVRRLFVPGSLGTGPFRYVLFSWPSHRPKGRTNRALHEMVHSKTPDIRRLKAAGGRSAEIHRRRDAKAALEMRKLPTRALRRLVLRQSVLGLSRETNGGHGCPANLAAEFQGLGHFLREPGGCRRLLQASECLARQVLGNRTGEYSCPVTGMWPC